MTVKSALFAKLLLLIGIAVVLMITLTAAAQGTEAGLPRYEYRTDPVLLVASYYNAINLQDYARAFSYWDTPPAGTPTLDTFAQGFADTARIAAFAKVPVFVDAGAGNLFASIPMLLVAQQTDGSVQVYSACFTAHKSNVPIGSATEPDPNWSLRNAQVAPSPRFDLAQLNDACPDTPPLGITNENLTSPVNLLTSYFGAIEQKDYARAFGYWETPPTGTPTLESFAQGFADTQDVSLILRLDVTEEGAAGSIYSSLPALVTSTLSNGTVQNFAGCYVARLVNVPVGDATEPDPNWHLNSAQVTALQTLPEGMRLLEGVCDNAE
jgi:hypothetical protein